MRLGEREPLPVTEFHFDEVRDGLDGGVDLRGDGLGGLAGARQWRADHDVDLSGARDVSGDTLRLRAAVRVERGGR